MKLATFLFLCSLYAFAQIPDDENFLRSYAALTLNYDPVTTSRVKGYSHKTHCKRDYVAVTGTDPLQHMGEEPRKRDIHLKVYTNRNWKRNDPTGKSKTFIIMPPLGGVTLVDNFYANYWCVRYPYRILMVEKWPGFLDLEVDAFVNELQFLDAVTTIRHVVEYSQEKSVGIIGNSLGAIYASLAMGVDERLTTGVLVVGGGDLPEVMGYSTVPRLVYLRNKRMKQFKLKNRREYIQYLRKNLVVDPLHFAPILRQKKIFFIADINDKEVPTKNQMLLKDAIKPAHYSQFKLGHVGAVIWTSLFYKQTFAGFFNRWL